MVYVGKNRGFHTRTQPEIHELLCQFAETGSSVLRLKGGDPFVFGRGGEEMQYLQERGIRVYTVPGEQTCTHHFVMKISELAFSVTYDTRISRKCTIERLKSLPNKVILAL